MYIEEDPDSTGCDSYIDEKNLYFYTLLISTKRTKYIPYLKGHFYITTLCTYECPCLTVETHSSSL